MKRLTRPGIITLMIASSLAACTGTGSQDPAATAAGTVPPRADDAISERPIDPSIRPVSRGNPEPEAKAALESCQLVDDARLDTISGMGFIPRSEDLPRYINITGAEPEIQSDGGVWAIVLKGELPQPMSHEVWLDATCVIIDGEQGYFATGGAYRVLEDGSFGPFLPPMQANPGPEWALPPLAP